MMTTFGQSTVTNNELFKISPRRLLIFSKLRDERIHPGKNRITAQSLQKIDVNDLPIQVTIEVEQMGLDQSITTVHGGTSSHIRHRWP